MKEILIFAGTSEGRELSGLLSDSGIRHTLCVATSYGKMLIEENPYVTVNEGRMDAEEITEFLDRHDFSMVVDATHPYAVEVTENIKKALEGRNIPYIRIKREGLEKTEGEKIFCFDTNEECLESLKDTDGNILLTVGSKELPLYAMDEWVKERLYVRIIPGEESLRICNELGISGKNIIAMQGPFSTALNEAMIDQFSIRHMVTKQSGTSGGFPEKVKSAQNKNIDLFVIGCSVTDDGMLLSDAIHEIEMISGKKIISPAMEINLIGAGMGDRDILTLEAEKVVNAADVIIGDRRLVSRYENSSKEVYEYYLSKDIIPLVSKLNEKDKYKKKKIAILFSGDSGFYSGASLLYDDLLKEIMEGRLGAELHVLPGISSVSYLSSKIGVSYSDAYICSMHGRELINITHLVKHNQKVFILLSGKNDINTLGAKLKDAGLKNLKIYIGIDLSYLNEKVICLSPDECISFDEDGILTCFVRNDDAESKTLTHGMKEDAFLRAKVPMTKEEVRDVSICKLRLKNDSVLWDVGSGTGSISVEAALLSRDLKVYSIECKGEAADLTQLNADKYNLENIKVVKGMAPEVFEDLPVPTHAFIGGSKGKLFEILSSLQDINNRMRIVINAVSMDTMSKIESIPKKFNVSGFEIVQMQVSRSDGTGDHLMMKAENPIRICSFDFDPGEEKS